MNAILKLDKSKIKIREYPYSPQVPVNKGTAARILEIAEGAKNGLILEIKRYYPPKSNQANKLMWKVCTDIANEISKEYSITKEDVYQKAIRDCGVYEDVPTPNDELQEKIRMWNSIGIGWFCEERSSLLEGGKTTLRKYYGSSKYNSKQMSILIRSLIDDAANMGLRIDDPATLALLSDEDKNYIKASQEAI